jgi:four helix bundle protein
MSFYVYGIKSSRTGRIYVGQAKDIFSDYFDITQGTFPRQKRIGPGCWSRSKSLRREQSHAGLSYNLRNRGANENCGFAVTRLQLRRREGATRRRAEGYGRFHYLDNAKFCSNARGSCWEVLDHLITGHDENLFSAELLGRGRELVAHAIKLLNGYMNYLKRAHKIAPVAD